MSSNSANAALLRQTQCFSVGTKKERLMELHSEECKKPNSKL